MILFNRLFAVLLCSLLAWVSTSRAVDFLEPSQAFKLTTTVHENTIHVHWTIAQGYHLYQDQLKLTSPTTQWKKLSLPPAKQIFDTNLEKMRMVYEYPGVDFDIQLLNKISPQPITLHWQGCADAGLCYAPDETILPFSSAPLTSTITPSKPPLSKNLALPSLIESSTPAVSIKLPLSSVSPTPSTISPAITQSSDSITETLKSKNMFQIIMAFGFAGLLLSFTPCMLPMLPILSSIIVGQNKVSRPHGLSLALAYTLGMATLYAVFGVAAGLAGEGLTAALQTPWALGGFATILCLLALPMFGFFEFQMPSFIQQRLTQKMNQVQGGTHIGVFVLGGLSSLVVGPCVAAPLAGALVYISQTKDVILGGFALFTLAMGMGVPLLIIGASAGKLLPKTGPWMTNINTIFGLMLLGVAINVIAPVITITPLFILCALWCSVLAFILYRMAHISVKPLSNVIRHTSMWGAMAMAVCLTAGAATGGTSLMSPLNNTPWFKKESVPLHHIAFKRIKTVVELEHELELAKSNGEITMLDFYADWCVACKEYENITFKDEAVINTLQPFRKLQVDVTSNTMDDKALMKRFNLFGPPGIIFFDADSNEKSRVIGYEGTAPFLTPLRTKVR